MSEKGHYVAYDPTPTTTTHSIRRRAVH